MSKNKALKTGNRLSYFGKFYTANSSSLNLTIADPNYVGDPLNTKTIPLPADDFIDVDIAYVDDKDWGTRVSKVVLSKRDAFLTPPRKFVESVLVDSASLVVFDDAFRPNWKGQNESTARCGTTYIDSQNRHWHCSLHWKPPPAFDGPSFGRFTDPIPELGGLSMTELCNSKLVRPHRYLINEDEFSASGSFATTTSQTLAGFLRCEGKAIAFAFRTGLGDGQYAIYADSCSILIDCMPQYPL